MAEKPDEKFKLPLTGLVALLIAAVSSFIIYQVPLKTSRPIDKEAEKYVSVKADRVQARLWQDPFEAVSTHQLKEAASTPQHAAPEHHTFRRLVQASHEPGGQSDVLWLPVFVDGSPYASGVESRLRDRYAVVSALGAAGYLPESGEYIRFFEWERPHKATVVVPVEWFLLDPKAGESAKSKQVLVFWLKEQDFSPNPLLTLEDLVTQVNAVLSHTTALYRVLGPRTSGSLGAMLSELKARHSGDQAGAQPATSSKTASPRPLDRLKGLVFYSSWATAADPFLLGDPTVTLPNTNVEEWFGMAGLTLIRTIGTDAALAEQLVEELKRRKIDLTIPRNEAGDCRKRAERPGAAVITSEAEETCRIPRVALISEWDTLYGRALPLTIVAMAETMAKTSEAKGTRQIDAELAVLRAGDWPEWVHRYSYLAGLDGELPPKGDDKDPSVTQAKGKPGEKMSGIPQSAEEVPTGRSQLDYVRRLAETLKRDAADFEAIGVLGSDVYDKLMILQALRDEFPRAVFFTTDLDARLTHSGQGRWTRNLIVASHFGLELHPALQTPIPPFRDSYQTALFYSALRAVEYVSPLPAEHEEVRNSLTDVIYSTTGRPRLYEIGRHGAVDLSLDEPRDIPSIHAPRPDLDLSSGSLRLPDAGKIAWALLALVAMTLCALLLNSEFLNFVQAMLGMYKRGFAAVMLVIAVSLLWAMSDGAGGEPFTLTQGISVWPTTFIRLVAFVFCLVFLTQASMRLRENDRRLTERFGFQPSRKEPKEPVVSHRLFGIHHWRPHPGGAAAASDIWQEYLSLGRASHRVTRISAQTLCYGLFGFFLMQAFGVPAMPCRGPACFHLNYLILALSVIGMTMLIFYVADATRLCRRFIKILIATKIDWPPEVLAKEAAQHDVDKSVLNEWLGIELIAQRTAVISFMLYYPFIVLFLMVVARHTYFDRWDFPVSLMVIFGLNAAYALGNAIYLRRSAEEAKRTALTQLRAKLAGSGEPAKKPQIERMADLIDHRQEGAFLPFTQHPLFGAIALPTGGTGLVLLIEYLATVL